jgi:hypothetical protein
METRYAVRWEGGGAEPLPIERMSDLEIAAALHALEREDASDPVASALLMAVSAEARRRQGARIEERSEAA